MELAAVAEDRHFLRQRLLAAASRFFDERRERLQLGRAEHSGCREAGHAGIETEQPRRRSIERTHVAGRIDGNHTSGDAFEDRLDVPPPCLDVLMFLLELDRGTLEPPAARRQVGRHAIEGLDQRAELVSGLRFHAMVQMSGADFVGCRRQHLHGPRDALGQVQSHPGRRDENHQRQHQEEREVNAGQRLLQDAELLVVFVGLRHASGARGELGGDVFARNDHALRRHPPAGADRDRAANQVAAVGQPLDDRRRWRAADRAFARAEGRTRA